MKRDKKHAFIMKSTENNQQLYIMAKNYLKKILKSQINVKFFLIIHQVVSMETFSNSTVRDCFGTNKKLSGISSSNNNHIRIQYLHKSRHT